MIFFFCAPLVFDLLDELTPVDFGEVVFFIDGLEGVAFLVEDFARAAPPLAVDFAPDVAFFALDALPVDLPAVALDAEVFLPAVVDLEAPVDLFVEDLAPLVDLLVDDLALEDFALPVAFLFEDAFDAAGFFAVGFLGVDLAAGFAAGFLVADCFFGDDLDVVFDFDFDAELFEAAFFGAVFFFVAM